MLFRVASVTKMFTATAVATFAEQGKLKLDAPIGSYVSGLTPQLSQVTLHQLLTHTAGIVAEVSRSGPSGEIGLVALARGWKDEQIFFDHPGKLYSYSNPGLVLAGLTLQEAGRKPYPTMMSDLLLQPLAMSRTTFRVTEAMTRPLSMGHDFGADKKPVIVRPFPDETENMPAGGMISNVADLSRFAIAFMNGGKLDGKQALSPSVIAKLTNAYADPHNASGDWRQGYGMRVGTIRGVRVVEHRGGTTGFGALLRMAPEHRFAVIILANSTLALLSKTTEKAMELMLPLRAATEEKHENALPLSAEEMNAYVGSYQNGSFKFQLFKKEEKLYLKLGEDEAPLKKTGERLLSIDEKPEEATAESALFKDMMLLPGADGRIEYLYFVGRALKRVPDANEKH
jgi:CubicO group peptidase (beta-lactamase class C family)